LANKKNYANRVEPYKQNQGWGKKKGGKESMTPQTKLKRSEIRAQVRGRRKELPGVHRVPCSFKSRTEAEDSKRRERWQNTVTR